MTYQELIDRILQLQDEGLEIFNAGKSTLGKNILATHVGDYDGAQILIQAGIHAREYITSLLLVEMARELHNNDLVKNGGIYFIFLVNPDGAQIVLDGISSLPCNITRQYLTLANNGSNNFSQYKANVNLVDLNTNFAANWGGGSQNVTCPSTQNFIGFYPQSEREVNSLIDFTLKTKPKLTISYHSKGDIIYYGFEGQTEQNRQRDFDIGTVLSKATGYPLVLTENSTGGYKDWCIQKLTIPAYTIEVGSEDLPHPIGEENLPEIYAQNKDVPLIALDKAREYANLIDFKQLYVQNMKYGKIQFTNAVGNNARIQSKAERRSTCWRSYRQKW